MNTSTEVLTRTYNKLVKKDSRHDFYVQRLQQSGYNAMYNLLLTGIEDNGVITQERYEQLIKWCIGQSWK